jgi:hypothetical protein
MSSSFNGRRAGCADNEAIAAVTRTTTVNGRNLDMEYSCRKTFEPELASRAPCILARTLRSGQAGR